LYRKIYKNGQVKLGTPFRINNSIRIKHTEIDMDDMANSSDEPMDESRKNVEDILKEAHNEADSIIKEAEYEALNIIKESEKNAEDLKKLIEEEAFNKGYSEGIDKANSDSQDMLKEAEFIKEHAKTEYKEVLENIENDAVNMIIDIAGKVINKEISLDKDYIYNLIREVIDNCTDKSSIIIKVSPKDHEQIKNNIEHYEDLFDEINEYEIRTDKKLDRGSCIAESKYGIVDASIGTKLRNIEKEFKKLIKEK
jgi:flagellar assembly protein FliH